MRILSLLISLALWYFISFFTEIPPPHEVFYKFLFLIIYEEPILGKTLIQHAEASLFRVLIASTVAFALAIPLGIFAGWSRNIREIIIPIVEVLRPIPPLAWIPLAYIIFAKLPNTVQVSQLYIVFVGAFFPCVVTVFDSARNVPEELIEMAKVYRANDWMVLRHIILPHSLQGILTGIRVGLGVGWMSIIAAEMIASSVEGLGYFILTMYEVGGRSAEIVSGIAMIGLIGYIMNYIFIRLERVLIPWR